MITVRLWHALRDPRHVKHPLARKMLLDVRPTVKLPVRVLVGGSIIIGMVLVCGLTYIVPPAILTRFAALPLVLPVLYLLLVFGGTGRGVTLAERTSSALAAEYDRETFETLAAAPAGALGAHWTILTASLQRDSNPEETNALQVRLTLMGFALVSFFLLIFYFNTWTRTAVSMFIEMPFVLYPLVAIYYIDYVCSMVTGALVGALSAATVRKPLEGRITAAAGFLALQFAGYGLAYGLTMIAVPVLFREIGFAGLAAKVSLAGLGVVIYYAVREVINWGLWRALAWRLGAAASERTAVMEG